MKIILTKSIKKWLGDEVYINEDDLLIAAKDILEKKYDASLGGGLYKKRISNSASKGKSSGSRIFIAYKKGSNLFFIYALNKNESANITLKEKTTLKERAKNYFAMTDIELKKAIDAKLFYVLKF